MIAYQAADLIWAVKIKKNAGALGLACRPVRSTAMLLDRLGDSAVTALIVDLDDANLALDLIRIVREHDATPGASPIRVLAFGPHVAVELLQRARDAGADEVMPRGALNRSLPDILQSLSEPK